MLHHLDDMECSLINTLSASKSRQSPNVHTHMYVIIGLLFCKGRLILCPCFYELHSRDAIATKDDSDSRNQVRWLLKSSF